MTYLARTRFLLGVGALPVLLSGCSDDVNATDDTATETSTSSSGPIGSTGPTIGDGTTGDTTVAMSSSADDTSMDTGLDTSGSVDETTGTTGAPIGSGRGRFVVRDRQADGTDDLVFVEYADGEIVSQSVLLPDLPDGAVLSTTSAIDDGRLLSLCLRFPPSLETSCGIVDLSTDPPGPFQSLASGAVPKGAALTGPVWSAATQTLYIAPRGTSEAEDLGIFAVRVTDGQLAPAELVQPPLAEPGLGSFVVSSNGEQLGYALNAGGGQSVTYVTSADPADETPAVSISTPSAEGQRNARPSFLLEHAAAYYPVRHETNLAPNIASLWFVDLSGKVPAAPVRLDDPEAAPARIHGDEPAPDQHALAYWVGPFDDIFAGELMWVALSSKGPQPPVRVSTLSQGAVTIRSSAWSPDSRWLGYEAAHEGDGRTDLYLLEASTQVPGEPVLVSEGLVADGRVTEWVFSGDSQHVYLTAQIGEELPSLFRVDLSGEEPGPLQTVAGPQGWVDEELIFSHDGTALLHSSYVRERELGLVDISGQRIGPSVLVNRALPKGSSVHYGAKFSADDSLVAYRERAPKQDSPRPLVLVDVASPGLGVVAEGIDAGAIYPAPIPR